MAKHKQSGRFVWYDLLTNDTEAAIDFYGNITGWGTEAFEVGPKPYTMLTNKGTPIGGLMEIEPEMGEVPPSWLAYISTPDVDETVEKIRELGGNIHAEPQDVPNAGRFAVAADPQGGVFAVFASTTGEPDMEAQPGVGEFSWHELATSDYQDAFDFYQALFGWEITSEMDMGGAGIYRMYGQNDLVYGGIFTKTDGMPGPPPPLVVFIRDGGRHRPGRRRCRGAWRQGAHGPHGGSRRGPDSPLHGSAGRQFRIALQAIDAGGVCIRWSEGAAVPLHYRK